MSIESELKKQIVEWSKKDFSDNVAEHLSVYYGALQAIQSDGGMITQENLKQAIETVSLGDKDFMDLIKTKNIQSVLLVIGELMEALRVINNRVYENVMLQIAKL